MTEINLKSMIAAASASFANRFDPVELTVAALPAPVDFPPDLEVLQHRTGYSMIELSNGDVVKIHLHITRMRYDPASNVFMPEIRLVPELVLSARGRSFVRDSSVVLS